MPIAPQFVRVYKNVAIFTRVSAIEWLLYARHPDSIGTIKPLRNSTTEHKTMKKSLILVSNGFANVMMLGIAATATGLLISAPARAANFSFSGNLNGANDTPSFLLVADGISTVNIQSSSYANGGFDPILTLFDATDNFLLEREDIGQPNLLDFQLNQVLPAGNYRAVISAFANFANQPNFTNGFGGGGDFFGRTSAYAFTIQGVTQANAVAVPEPVSLIGAVVAGFAAVRLKRKLSSKK